MPTDSDQQSFQRFEERAYQDHQLDLAWHFPMMITCIDDLYQQNNKLYQQIEELYAKNKELQAKLSNK